MAARCAPVASLVLSACTIPSRPRVYFVGTGAERFATQHGMRLVDNAELIVPRERDRLMRFQQAELAGHPDTTFSGNSEFTATPSASSNDPALRQTALDTEVE